MTWITRPLARSFGVEVIDCDLTREPVDLAHAALRQLLDQHSLILFRGQSLSPDDHVGALSAFGRVSDEQGDGVRHAYVSNVRDDGLFGDWPLPFHQDYGTFQIEIAPVISLYGHELHGASMPTAFASLVQGYHRLPDRLRTAVADLNATHAVDLTVDTGSQGFEKRARLLELAAYPPASTHPRQTYPVIHTHPRTGAPMLFVSEMHTSHIEGYDSKRSEELVQALFAILYDRDHLYIHDWAMGDLLIWDNVALQHGRRPETRGLSEQRRTLRRVVVCDKSTREIFKNINYNNSRGFKAASRS